MADPKEVEKWDTLFEVERIQFTEEFRDPSYEIRVEEPATMTYHGHLKLFELVTTEVDLPVLLARWDERPETVDIDALDRDGNPLQEWKNKQLARKMGHRGHHTEPRPDYESLAFECCLIWKGRPIFCAIVELLGRRIRKHLTATVTATSSAKMSMEIIRARPKA